MSSNSPEPITRAEMKRRKARVVRVARRIGFVGRVDYLHVYGQSGGAQYGRGSDEAVDRLTVYAEAIERDGNPDDFSLLAIIAHERGHQLLARHRQLSSRLAGMTLVAEEVLASILGAKVCGSPEDCDALLAKAMLELLAAGVKPQKAVELFENLWDLIGEVL